MTTQELVERLHLLRVTMEHQGGVSLCDIEAPAALVFFDVMGALEVPIEAQVYVLGVDNALRLRQEYGIEWEEV